MNFIQQWLNIYSKGLEFDNLEDDYNTLQASYDAVVISNSDLINEVELVQFELKEALKQPEPLNILDLKEWYENKYGSKPWTYNFNSDGKQRDIKYALRETTGGAKFLREYAQIIFDKYKPQTPTEVVEVVMRWFKRSTAWKYTSDVKQFNKLDFWQTAEDSLNTFEGDCDDLAILMHCLIYHLLNLTGYESHYWRVKLCIADLLGEGGHALNVWLGDDGEWYAVESTYDLKGSFDRSWLKAPIKYNNLYKGFRGFARKDKSWNGNLKVLDGYEDK